MLTPFPSPIGEPPNHESIRKRIEALNAALGPVISEWYGGIYSHIQAVLGALGMVLTDAEKSLRRSIGTLQGRVTRVRNKIEDGISSSITKLTSEVMPLAELAGVTMLTGDASDPNVCKPGTILVNGQCVPIVLPPGIDPVPPPGPPPGPPPYGNPVGEDCNGVPVYFCDPVNPNWSNLCYGNGTPVPANNLPPNCSPIGIDPGPDEECPKCCPPAPVEISVSCENDDTDEICAAEPGNSKCDTTVCATAPKAGDVKYQAIVPFNPFASGEGYWNTECNFIRLVGKSAVKVTAQEMEDLLAMEGGFFASMMGDNGVGPS